MAIAPARLHSRGRVTTVLVILLPTLTLSLLVGRVFDDIPLSVRSAGAPAAPEELAPPLWAGERAASDRAGPGLPYEAGVGLPTSSPAMMSLLDVKADKVRAKKRAGRRMLSGKYVDGLRNARTPAMEADVHLQLGYRKPSAFLEQYNSACCV